MTQLREVRHSYNSPIEDADVVWTVQLYNSYAQLEWCLKHLRISYPTARVVLISDGDGIDYAPLADRNGCELHIGEHLMTRGKSHLYVRRMLALSVSGSQSYCFRIDPDTRIWRRFTQLPGFSAVFGTLETISEGRSEIEVPANVQGGCIGFTRDAAEAILGSECLTELNCSARAMDTWARCADMRAAAERGTFCDDFVLSWAAYECRIPIVECAEIRSRWRRRVDNGNLRYAVTHPHKLEQ